MLLDREEERRRIDRLLDGARSGTSGTLLLRGEAGIGKSELLRYAVDSAGDMTVLQASGVESESELPFAALADLLRPVINHLPRIPEPQAAALAGALALAQEAAGDRFAVSAATLSLLAAAAEERAVLAVVDDLQWVDGSSREALLFAARRLGAEGVAVLLAARDSVDAFRSDPIPELELTGLPGDAAIALVGAHTEWEVAPNVAERLVTATAGNPLALIESPGLLSEGQLAGREPLPEPIPAGPSVQRAFLLQVSSLPDVTREALLVAAASETGATEEVIPALSQLGIDGSALEPAEEAGLIQIEGADIRFRHPLLRSAIYQGATGPRRRAAHLALASALANVEAANATDRRAWHIAHSVVGHDESAALAMEEAAVEARRRRGHAAAGSAFERAATITPDRQERARRLLEAARDLNIAGQGDRATELLEEAAPLAVDPITGAEIQHLRARIAMFRARPMAAHAVLVDGVERVAALDRERAAMMLAEATFPSMMAGNSQLALATAQRAYGMAKETGGPALLPASVFLALALAARGEVGPARELATACHSAIIGADPLSTVPLVPPLAAVLEWTEEFDLGMTLLTRAIDASRSASAVGLLPLPLATRADFSFRLGLWASASADASEATALSSDTGQYSLRTYGLVALALVEAGQGRAMDCHRHASEAAELARSGGVQSIVYFADAALGLLALSDGRAAEAISHLQQVADMAERDGVLNPLAVQWQPNLIEAYIRAGQTADAERALDTFASQAGSADWVWPRATAARCRGLLASEVGFEGPFEEALGWHDRLPMPFEQARTEFCFGERLRRARRVAEGRDVLHRALAGFQHLGAGRWAERTATELRATGERVPRPRTPARLELTPQELQVALLVARGGTNREVASALFLSPKTVEFHLGHVYGKLGVRSRTEMARVLLKRGTGLPAHAGPTAAQRPGPFRR